MINVDVEFGVCRYFMFIKQSTKTYSMEVVPRVGETLRVEGGETFTVRKVTYNLWCPDARCNSATIQAKLEESE